MADELPAVELVEAFLHLRAEPAIMVDVLLDQLLDVLSRAGLVLGGGLRELGLGFGREVDFHPLTIAAAGESSVVEQERMSTEPCGKNPAGECDVAWA